MRKVILLMILVLVYFLTWPTPVEPEPWYAPTAPGYTNEFAENDALAAIELIPLEQSHGPEDIAVGPNGYLYFPTHAGAIMRFLPGEPAEVFTLTGGRPLGIEFDQDGSLLVADAYRGLLRVSPQGVVEILTTQAGGVPIRYADDVDVAADGRIYFSDASTKFGAEQYGGTLEASLLDIMEHGGHGRLLRFDPRTRQTEVLLNGLQFANGVVVSENSDYLLIVETGEYRVLKYWLEGPRKDFVEVIIDNLPGFPDNLNRNPQGSYWLGLVSPRNAILDQLSAYPRVRKMVQRLPAVLRPKAENYAHIIKLTGTGQVLESLQDPNSPYSQTTGAIEHQGELYISSLTAPAIAVLPYGSDD